MSKKVLLVNPPSFSSLYYGGNTKKISGGHELELGSLYVASFLESKGIDVSFLDMSLYDNPEERLISALKQKDYDFAGLTAYSNFVTIANQVAGIIKQNSRAKTVIGGAHASALPEETFRTFNNFYYLIYGEGEETFFELTGGEKSLREINGLVWRNEGEMVKNPPRDPINNLDDLPIPARHLLDINQYVPLPGNYHQLPSTAILSSRGCPFLCTYCSRTGSRLKNSVRFRSVANVISEIEHCIKNYGIYDFRFYDDTFVIPKSRLLDFCRELLKRKIKISWNCYSRVDTIDMEMLELMRKAGCYHIKYGVEFGTARMLKQTKKNATLDQARKAIKATKKAGIAAKASFMIGMPGETAEEIRETIKFASELNPTYSTFGIFVPLPGSEIFNVAKEDGTLLHNNYGEYFKRTKKVLANQLDDDILKKLIKEAYRKTYLNPGFFLHRLNHLRKNFSWYEIRMLWDGVCLLFAK